MPGFVRIGASARRIWVYATRVLTNPAEASDLLNMLVGISPTAAGRAALLDEITAARMAELDPANMPGDIDTLLTRLTATRAALIDNLDVLLSTRLASADFDTRLSETRAERIDNLLDKVPYTTKEIKLYPDGENYSAWAESGLGGGPPTYEPVFVWGSWVEVVPADTITEDFIILGVATCTADTAIAGEFHVQIGVGGAGEEVPKACVHGHIMQDGAGRALFGETIPLPIPVKLSANSRVAARSSFEDYDVVSRAFGVKVMYIELPL